jgi:hypothetical protein
VYEMPFLFGSDEGNEEGLPLDVSVRVFLIVETEVLCHGILYSYQEPAKIVS